MEGCPVHCGMFDGVPGFYPLDASRDNQKCLQTFPGVPWETKCPPVVIH